MRIKHCYLYIMIFFLLFGIGCKKTTYEVSFDTDGGNSISSITVNENDSVNAPHNPIKTGYSFNGWYLNDQPYDFNTPVTSNITLKAKWDLLRHKVSFDSDNGESITIIDALYNETVSSISTPIKDGYDFLGWYLQDDLYDFNTPITSDIILTAKWCKSFDKSLCIGSFGATISEDNKEYLFFEIDDYYQGIINHISGNNSYKYNIVGISSNKGILEISYNVNEEIKKIIFEYNDGKLILAKYNGQDYELYVPTTYTVTYHLHDNTTKSVTVYENSIFGTYNYEINDSLNLVLDGWYLSDGILVNSTDIVKSDLDVYANVYTDGLIFENNELIYYDGECPFVLVPRYFEGHIIDTVSDYAFVDCLVESVMLPDTIRVIGDSAFEGCVLLSSINVFEGITEIGEKAFYLCNNLTTFNIPSTVLKIGTFAFSFTSIKSVVFPENIEYIGSYAYHACNSLEEVEFLGSVPCEIGSTLFTYTNDDYENLEIYYSNIPIYIPDGENNPYKEYRSHINLRDYASSIYPKSVKGQTGYIIIDNILLGHINDTDTPLTYLDVPSGVTEIDDFAFYGNIRIEEIDMKEGFLKIGKYAFYNCTSVKNLYIPKSMQEIDDYAFTGFFVGNNISRLYFPEGFKRVGEGAFLSSFNLKIIEFPTTLEHIGYLAFGMGNSLERVSFASNTPPEVGVYTNDVGDSFKDIFSIVNAGKTTIYVPFETINGEKVVDLYKKADGFKEFETYIKAQPEGTEVGHYGDGFNFIDLDGCDRVTFYKLVESENDTTSDGGSRYEYVKEEGEYVINGFRLEMTFKTYGKIIAIYGNRSINFTYDNVTYNLKEPKRYYDSYNWTNFDLFETSENKGNGIFEMYGSFLTPFTYEIVNNEFKINIDGNNKLPENADYAGVREYVGSYNKQTDTFSVSFMLNDYFQLMDFTASYNKIVYPTKETARLSGKYVAYATETNYAMFTLISDGTGLVDVYIGENCYEDCSYTLIDNVLTIDVQSFIVTVNMTKDGFISGNFMGVDTLFIYEDELMDSTKLPSRDDI